MLDTTFTRVVATSLKGYSRTITENIVGRIPFLWKLGQLGGIETRPGATSIVEPIILNTNTNVSSYAGADPLLTAAQTGITAAELAWKQIAGTASITGIEKFKNSGQATQVINLWDAIGQQLAMSMRIEVNRQLFLDGTGNGGKDLTGLDLAVEEGTAWSTYAEIDSNAETNWRNQFQADPGDVFATPANFATALRKLVNSCTGGGDWPHLIVTSKELHEAWESTLVSNERYLRVESDEDMVRNGFTNFLFKDIPTVFDDNISPHTNAAASVTAGHGTVVLNLDYFKYVMGEGYDFTFTDPIRPDNQDLESVQCLLYSNVILKNRRRQGRCNMEYTP